MYHINWRAVTGKTGHGKPVFKTFDEAQKVVDELDHESIDIQHWVEVKLVEESGKENEAKNET